MRLELMMASQFATALAQLLDRTSAFSRAEWARILDVDISVLSGWTEDLLLPEPAALGAIREILNYIGRVPRRPLHEFDRIAALPSVEVSPFGDRMAPTVGDYIRSSQRNYLSNNIYADVFAYCQHQHKLHKQHTPVQRRTFFLRKWPWK